MKSGDIFYPVVWREGMSGGIRVGWAGSCEWKVLGGAACWNVGALWGEDWKGG